MLITIDTDKVAKILNQYSKMHFLAEDLAKYFKRVGNEECCCGSKDNTICKKDSCLNCPQLTTQFSPADFIKKCGK